MMNILVSPNAFKSALSANETAAAICRGFERSDLECKCIELPIADGGDGSLDVISKYLNAEIKQVKVKDPIGRKVDANFGWNDTEKTAIVELAEASGLQLIKEEIQNPLKATTFGTGQLMMEALNLGAKRIYLTLGGSATVDGAIGILDAMGVVFKGHDGILILNPIPSDLHLITEIDTSKIEEQMRGVEMIILCDVKNPLLGDEGAASVFGPQKGASDDDVKTLENGLSHFADVIEEKFDVDIRSVRHGGAAGGISAVLHGVLGASLVDGAEQILDWANFDEAVSSADIVITAEGQIDEQTAYGKGPGRVVKKAKGSGKLTIGMSGSVEADDMGFENFDMVLPIVNAPGKLSVAFANTAKNLERTAYQLGQFLAALEQGRK